jgi:hypothetical protein
MPSSPWLVELTAMCGQRRETQSVMLSTTSGASSTTRAFRSPLLYRRPPFKRQLDPEERALLFPTFN